MPFSANELSKPSAPALHAALYWTVILACGKATLRVASFAIKVSEALRHPRSSELWPSVWLLKDFKLVSLAASLGLRQLITLRWEPHAPAKAHPQSKGSQKFWLTNQGHFPSRFFQPESKILQSTRKGRSIYLQSSPWRSSPNTFFQAPLLLRCSLNHLERNLPPELTPSKCFLMDTPCQGSWRYSLHWSMVWPCILQWKWIPDVLPALRDTMWSIFLVLHLAWHYFMASPNI